MNFMPAEDAFFDEPLVDTHASGNGTVPAHPSFPKSEILPTHSIDAVSQQLLESSRNQEKLLLRLVCEVEKLTRRLTSLETLPSIGSTVRKDTQSPASTPTSTSRSLPPQRGALVLPPGCRSTTIPSMTVPKAVSSAEDNAVRQAQNEELALQRRRADEEARLARIESERKEREAEDERRRVLERKRIEEEKRIKEELERKTRGLMTGLLTSGPGGGLFDDDLGEFGSNKKGNGTKTGGLFDD